MCLERSEQELESSVGPVESKSTHSSSNILTNNPIIHETVHELYLILPLVTLPSEPTRSWFELCLSRSAASHWWNKAHLLCMWWHPAEVCADLRAAPGFLFHGFRLFYSTCSWFRCHRTNQSGPTRGGDGWRWDDSHHMGVYQRQGI